MPTHVNIETDAILTNMQVEFLGRCEKAQDEVTVDELRVLHESGFLIQAVPEELGGLGLSQNEVIQQLDYLALNAPIMTQAVSSHIGWTGIAAERWLSGDRSLDWLLRDACSGDIFVDGVTSSAGSSMVCNLEPADGGCCVSGDVSMGYLSQSWSRLIVCGRTIDASKAKFAFISRGADGLRFSESNRVILDAVFVSDKYIVKLDTLSSFESSSTGGTINNDYRYLAVGST